MYYISNKFLIFSAFVISSSLAFSQETQKWGDVTVLENSLGHKIAPDGSFSTGEAIDAQSSWGRDNKTGEIFFYYASSCGDGNNITKNHVVVGTDQFYMKGAFLLPEQDADPVLIPSLEKYSESYLHGINWEGTRCVGIVANPRSYNVDEIDPNKQTMAYLPIYCDINPETLEVSDPVFLPTPEFDFFGLVPQYCTAFWINDQGNVILGQVIDNSGKYVYPIVYTQQADGSWTHKLPSESLFNPDNLPVPQYPVPEINAPDPAQYIENPEMKALFEDLLDQMLLGADVNPYEMLNPATAGEDALMTREEYASYMEAQSEYDSYVTTIYQPLLEKYNDEISLFITHSNNFLQSSMTMNREGTLIGQTKITTKFAGTLPIEYLRPVVFNLENDTYEILGEELSELELSQILPDGTLIALYPRPNSKTPDLTPQHTYVAAPETNVFIPIQDYIKNENPEVYDWFQEYLYHSVEIGYDETGNIATKDLVVSGLVAVSDDFKNISGGLDAWTWDYETGDYYTYFITNLNAPNAGIEALEDGNTKGIKVFNMQGVKVWESSDASLPSTLPEGIYIINGKKTLIH